MIGTTVQRPRDDGPWDAAQPGHPEPVDGSAIVCGIQAELDATVTDVIEIRDVEDQATRLQQRVCNLAVVLLRAAGVDSPFTDGPDETDLAWPAESPVVADRSGTVDRTAALVVSTAHAVAASWVGALTNAATDLAVDHRVITPAWRRTEAELHILVDALPEVLRTVEAWLDEAAPRWRAHADEPG